jgi:hypothetical protein
MLGFHYVKWHLEIFLMYGTTTFQLFFDLNLNEFVVKCIAKLVWCFHFATNKYGFGFGIEMCCICLVMQMT